MVLLSYKIVKHTQFCSTEARILEWVASNIFILSAIKRNAIVPFAETWMDLEPVIQTEVSQNEKDKYHIISLICGIEKNSTNALTYKTERDSQTLRTNLWLPGGRMRGRDSWGVWDGHVHTAIFKMDNQQGPAV